MQQAQDSELLESELRSVLEALRTAQRERDEARRANELLERERDDAKMRRDMALQTADANFWERKQLEEELRKVNGAYVSNALDNLKAKLSHAVHVKGRLLIRLKTVKQERDTANEGG